MALMCASVVPQQPPTMLSQPFSMKRSSWAASDVGVSGILALFVRAGRRSGSRRRGRATISLMVRMWSVMNSGPVAQLRPIESRSACIDRGAEGVGGLAGEHGAHGLDRARDHGGDPRGRVRAAGARWRCSAALTLRVS